MNKGFLEKNTQTIIKSKLIEIIILIKMIMMKYALRI